MQSNKDNRIFLIGYMGAGKTTIGEQLAERLGYKFLDMDHVIEEKMQQSVSQIFSEKGEEEFRRLERECLEEISTEQNVVVATGGGAPCFYDNMERMNAYGLTVYLCLSPEQLQERLELSHKNKRPLLAQREGKELLDFIRQNLSEREPFYRKAALVVSGTDEEMFQQILSFLSSHS
ncbi:MAG TPA: shikimate kinase [Paludibacteraceae bacterium]|nr:shikimate kinase [Paludibacteraceae bacterium]HPL77276.1 shikimate kinase [Paludibacteraceae bacterium]